jgi:acetoin utilization protein AcuB
MIVSEVMATKLVTVTSNDTLSHAANLLRQHQFHHLPVVQAPGSQQEARNTLYVLEGLLTAQDIDMAAASGKSSVVEGDPVWGTGNAPAMLQQPWQERRIVEVMHRATIRVNPNTDVAAAAQILVERGLNCLPVVEYEQAEQGAGDTEPETRPVLVGLLTRSDLLIALARLLGALEPGMQLIVPLPTGNLTPLTQTLLLAAELHIPVRSVLAAPMEGSVPRVAMVRLGTINPTPLLVRLQKANIQYTFANPLAEGGTHV